MQFQNIDIQNEVYEDETSCEWQGGAFSLGLNLMPPLNDVAFRTLLTKYATTKNIARIANAVPVTLYSVTM